MIRMCLVTTLLCTAAVSAQVSPEIERFVTALKSPDQKIRANAAEMLAKMESVPPEVIPVLCFSLIEATADTKKPILAALAKHRSDLHEHLDGIVTEMKTANWQEKKQYEISKLMQKLGQMGTKAQPAESFVRYVVKEAYYKPEPWLDKAGPGGYNGTVTAAGLKALRAFRPIEKLTYDQISTMAIKLSSRKPYVRLDALETLRELAQTTDLQDNLKADVRTRTLHALFDAVRNDAENRPEAIKYVAEFGNDAKEILPKVKEFLRSTDEKTRDAARAAVKKLEAK